MSIDAPLPSLDDVVWTRSEEDEAATEHRIAALTDEITGLERHLEEIRLFRGMLASYARADEAPASTAEPSPPVAPAPDAVDRDGPREGSSPPGAGTAHRADITNSVRAAAQQRLPEWIAWLDAPERPQPRRSDMAYAVSALCRLLCSIESNAEATEDEALDWAEAALPEPWCTTVARSRAWRADTAADESVTAEVRAFVHWAAERELDVIPTE